MAGSSRSLSKTLTDNDHIDSKVLLRLEALARLGAPRRVRVLDAFHGHGKLWSHVIDQAPRGWDISLYRADKERRAAGTLRVNNVRLLEALDLATFDLIDLDTYGWPAAQLKLVATKAPNVPVLTTRISRSFGQMPKVVTDDLGLDEHFTRAAPTLIVTLADELWEAWLYLLGYRYSRLLLFDHHAGFKSLNGGKASQSIKRYELLLPEGWDPTPPEGFVTLG